MKLPKPSCLLLTAACLFLASGICFASASNIYIAQNSAGAANGSSCANAYGVGFFNNSGDWGSGSNQIGAGTTVHLCGTFSVGANTNILTFQGSGAPGNPVTVLFESGAILESPYFPAHGSGSSGAINFNGRSYITIDGGTNGLIQNTNNGTNLGNQQSSTALEGDGATNVTIKNLTVSDIYVHTSASDTSIPDDGATCVYTHGVITNWTISNNTFHDMSWCLEFQYAPGTSSNVTVNGNKIYNVDHGIAFGGYPSGANLNTVTIYGNNIHDYSNWDTTSNAYHHDGIHVWGYNDDGSDSISGISIYDNNFGGDIGNNVTAHIFIEHNNGGTSNVTIYNNVLTDTANRTEYNGFVTPGGSGSDSGYKIYNNTAIGGSNDTCFGTEGWPNVLFQNNVASGCGILMYVTTGGGFASGGLHNNVYAGSGSNAFAYRGNFSGSLSTWQNETGQDVDSTYVSNADLSSSGQPSSSSPVVGAGDNLTALSLTNLDTAINGVLRPTAGPWDAGAFELGTSAGVNPPGGLTTVVH